MNAVIGDHLLASPPMYLPHPMDHKSDIPVDAVICGVVYKTDSTMDPILLKTTFDGEILISACCEPVPKLSLVKIAKWL